MIALAREKAVEMENLLRERSIVKEYLCRVKGNFMGGLDEEIVCDRPVKIISHKLGLCSVREDGKPCITIFKRLSYNGITSLVSCRPLTGRMHQIRVHLLWLGYPIANDVIYHERAWTRDVDDQGQISLSRNPNYIIGESTKQLDIDIDMLPALCEECYIVRQDPQPHQLCIWLHALTYSTQSWSYTTPLPAWTSEDFSGDRDLENLWRSGGDSSDIEGSYENGDEQSN